MVNFLNIRIENNYIYAVAEDCDNGDIKKNVKVHITKEEYYIEGGNENASSTIIRGLWALQRDYANSLKGKKKMPVNRTVAWY